MIAALALLAPLLLVGSVAARIGPPRRVVTAPLLPRRAPEARRAPARVPRWAAELVAAEGLAIDLATVWPLARAWALPVLVGTALVLGPAAAGAMLAGAVALPKVVAPLVHRRHLDRRDGQLPAFLERLAGALRAGATPPQAFVEVAAAAPEPLRSELLVVVAEVSHGAGMPASLHRWARQPRSSPAVRLAATALGLGVEAGGEVARSIDRVASTLRERGELRAEVHALATQARTSAAVLALAPVAFLVLISGIEPGVAHLLLTTPLGLLCLVGGISLDAGGAVWMSRIVASDPCA